MNNVHRETEMFPKSLKHDRGLLYTLKTIVNRTDLMISSYCVKVNAF